MKPVIAVAAQTAIADTIHYGEQRLTSLYDLYVRAIQTAGGIPIVLARGTPADAAALLERCDALVLPGGGDIDPSSYREEPASEHLYDVRPLADEFEMALVREAADHRLPVLGICRGLQVINVALGGSLHQHLPEHPKDLAGRAYAGHYLTRVRSGSRVHRVVGSMEILVNSLHHQGVKDLGTGLAVAATSHDGVVEAIESIDDGWEVLAVQWHPECLQAWHTTAIFDWLVTAARHHVASQAASGATVERNGNLCSFEPREPTMALACRPVPSTATG